MHWEKLWHPIFEEKYLALLTLVEREIENDPEHFYDSKIYKFFECVTDCIENRIFIDPKSSEFVLGNTLGKTNRDWRRAKKGMPNRYRLFFKYSTSNKSIVLAWFNDEKTLRKANSKTDVYEVFKKMLAQGILPSNMQDLINASSEAEVQKIL